MMIRAKVVVDLIRKITNALYLFVSTTGINMTFKHLYILRGLPGSGKSNTAYRITNQYKNAGYDVAIISADDFFMVDGVYRCNKYKITEAHEACKINAINKMSTGTPCIIIDNTNVHRWEYQIYIRLAKVFGYEINYIDIFDGDLTNEVLTARNIHNIPLETIAKMRIEYEPLTAEEKLHALRR